VHKQNVSFTTALKDKSLDMLSNTKVTMFEVVCKLYGVVKFNCCIFWTVRCAQILE